MATITVIQPSIMTETVKRRVAAYCRVSSSSEDQLNSYQVQLTYYSHKFEESYTEELVDLYADEGITGTREDKRDEFQRLMKDCRRGKIDRIYTKSISRFARNTKDCLKNLRELKSLGITVFFEKENIDTANMTDEIMITILGGLAQEESVSISQNMRWSAEKRMQNGTFIASTPPYGYKNQDGKLVINAEEA
ncbi:MAG: recombinase family protein, partial [Ruminococcus sp.]|nr:recombinase family protein [Ruminococcus sp.]